MLYVVTGPPAAGKSTWVREHAQPGDVVVDYDLIAAALSAPSSGTTHDHQGAVRATAFRARSAAIREALSHAVDVDVYIIHALPPADALARYAEHRAHLITVDPGQDVVMARIAEQRPAAARAVARRWYSQADRRQGQEKGRSGRQAGRSAAARQGRAPDAVHTPPPRASRSW